MLSRSRVPATAALRPPHLLPAFWHPIITTTTTTTQSDTIKVTVREKEEHMTLEPSEASIREIEEEFDKNGQLPFEKLSGNWNRASTSTAEYQTTSKIEQPYSLPGEDRRYGCMRMLREQNMVDSGVKPDQRVPD